MIVKLLVLVSAVAFVSSDDFELSETPKACSVVRKVGEGSNYEKTMCHVQIHTFQPTADNFCRTNGMRLYDPHSSELAWQALLDLGQTVLGGSKLAQVYVLGREGDRCTLFAANGELVSNWCPTSYYFVCEYFEAPVFQCEDYHTHFSESKFVDAEGIESPQACVFHEGIWNPRAVLTVDSTVLREDIIALDLAYTVSFEYLPAKIALNFPNLNVIRAQSCSIKELSRSSFTGLTKLKFLDLDENSISVLLTETFIDVVNLQRIDLDNNPITTISSDFFIAFPKLSTVWLKKSGCINAYVEFSIQKVNTMLLRTNHTCEIV